MSALDPEEAARNYARFLSTRKGTKGSPSPAMIDVSETSFDPQSFDINLVPGGGGFLPLPIGEAFFIVMEDGTSFILTELYNGILLET